MGDPDGKPYIVLYGSDPGLLKTRHWVLETAGFRVASAASGPEAERLLGAGPAAILMLCHSLPIEACEQAIAAAAALSPQTRTIILDGKDAPALKGLCHAIFDAMEGPEALIETLRQVIASVPAQRARPQIVIPRQ